MTESSSTPSRAVKFMVLEAPLSDLFDRQSIQRGEEYWHDGMVVEIAITGTTVKARVLGNYLPQYEVIIDLLQSRRRLNARCTCPIGQGCKHVVAVILALRNEWRDTLERHLSFLESNPLGVDLLDMLQNPRNATNVLQTILKKVEHDELVRILAEVLPSHPQALIELTSLFTRHEPSARELQDKDLRYKDLMRIMSGCNEALKRSLQNIFYQLHFDSYYNEITDDMLIQFNDEVFMPLLRYLQGVKGSLVQTWPLWKKGLTWMSKNVPKMMREYRDAFIAAHDYYIFEDGVVNLNDVEELSFLLNIPIRRFFLQFLKACWSQGDEITEEITMEIFSSLYELFQRYDIQGDLYLEYLSSVESQDVPLTWMQVLLAALNPSKSRRNALKKRCQHLFKSSDPAANSRMGRLVLKALKQLERQGRKKSLLVITRILRMEEEATEVLEFLRMTDEFKDDREFQYQYLMTLLHVNWNAFNDLFPEIFLIKDMNDQTFVEDLVTLFKKTNAFDVVKESLARARLTKNPNVIEHVQSTFIRAAADISPQLHVLTLIKAEKVDVAAEVFFTRLYPNIHRAISRQSSEYYLSIDQSFIYDVLPNIMAFNVEKSEKLLKMLIEVNIARKDRKYYQVAASWAEILKTLLVNVKKLPKEWDEYIENLIHVRYRRRPALRDEMKRLL